MDNKFKLPEKLNHKTFIELLYENPDLAIQKARDSYFYMKQELSENHSELYLLNILNEVACMLKEMLHEG
jgi:hypothetical protein